MAATEEKEEEGEGLSEETANEKVVGDEAAITTHPSGPGHTGTRWGEERGRGGTGSGKQIWEAGGGEVEESVEGRGKKKVPRRLRRKYHNNSFDI